MRRIKREQISRPAKAMGVSEAYAAALLDGATVRRKDPIPKLASALVARITTKEKS